MANSSTCKTKFHSVVFTCGCDLRSMGYSKKPDKLVHRQARDPNQRTWRAGSELGMKRYGKIRPDARLGKHQMAAGLAARQPAALTKGFRCFLSGYVAKLS